MSARSVATGFSALPCSRPRYVQLTLGVRARSTFLSNLPTLVLGTSSTNVQRSGSHHRRPGRRGSRQLLGGGGRTLLDDHRDQGRSLHRSSGTAITAASATAGWAITSFSSSTDEIHSPPDLITSLARSLIGVKPSSSSCPMSPVRSQPSWNFSGAGLAVVGPGDPRPPDLDLADRLAVLGQVMAVVGDHPSLDPGDDPPGLGPPFDLLRGWGPPGPRATAHSGLVSVIPTPG